MKKKAAEKKPTGRRPGRPKKVVAEVKSVEAAKPVEAKKPGRPAKKDAVLQQRTDKVVCRDKDTVLKIFGPNLSLIHI